LSRSGIEDRRSGTGGGRAADSVGGGREDGGLDELSISEGTVEAGGLLDGVIVGDVVAEFVGVSLVFAQASALANIASAS
jgi:hypothetical protein